MSAQNAKDAADEIIARLHLGAGDTGRKFQLVTFNSEEDCRFFYPRRALDWQRQVNTYVSRGLRERFGVRVQRVSLTPADYYEWKTQQTTVSAYEAMEDKRRFADEHLKLLA